MTVSTADAPIVAPISIFKKIVGVEIGEDAGHAPHTLVLTFREGGADERRLFDMAPLLGIGMFAELAEPAYFRRAFVDEECATVAWPRGQDLNPNHFYDESTPLP